MKRFFITGGYATSNPGDVAILKATVSRLRALDPSSHFVIWTDRKEFSADLPSETSYEMFLCPCPWFFHGNRYIPRTCMALYRLFYPFSQGIVRRLCKKKMDSAVRKMKGCHFIVFVGGGYINSNYAFDLMQMHWLSCLAAESGCPVYLLGQTLGPFKSAWHRRVAEAIFRRAERIVLRERYSISELGKFSDKALDGVDDALGFQTAPLPGGNDRSDVLLGLNLRSTQKPQDYSGLVQSLNLFNTKFVGGRLKVLFIFMETSVYCDDRKEADWFGLSGPRNFEFEVLRGPLTVEARFAAISRTDIFLGMRFHSLVFSLSAGVPCIGLYAGEYYFRKNRGLLEKYGMERYALPMERVSQLADLLGDLYQNRAQLRLDLREKHAQVLKAQEQLYEALFAARSS